jgi:OmpA-OmpF porin, OOP family
MRSCHVGAAVLASAALLMAPPARAQGFGDLALDQLEPSPAGDAFLGVPSPFIGGHLTPRVLALVDHASDPLVLQTSGSSASVVGSQTMLHLDASLALWDRLQADVLLPLALTQGGAGPSVGGNALSVPDSPAIGDLRLGLRVRILGGEDDPVQLAFGASLYLPTGATRAFVGERGVRDRPYLSLGGRARHLVWSAAVGAVIRGSDRNPSMFTYGGGVAAVLAGGLVQVGPELFAATPLQDGSITVAAGKQLAREGVTNAELLLSARLRLPAGFTAFAGGGVGLSEAIGTPAFRVVGGVGWALPTAHDAASRDRDEDGIPDAEDACPFAFGPKEAEPQRRGCPAGSGDEAAPAGEGEGPR